MAANGSIDAAPAEYRAEETVPMYKELYGNTAPIGALAT